MAANVESIMYVSNEENNRFVPWHGLGTAVEEAPTSADAIRLAGLDWNVESKPIFTDGGIEIPGYKANTRDIDGSVLGIVSDRYQIVQNAEAFDFTDSLIGEGCKYETAGSLLDGKKIFLLARMPERDILGDQVDPYICFTNNHNGTGAIQVCMTPIRVVCQNTLNLALNQSKRKWSTRHIGDMQSKLAEAKYTLQLANDYMDNLEITADQLAHTKVTEEQVMKMLDELFPVSTEDSDRKKNNVAEVKDQFIKCLHASDITQFRNTGWGVINAASDWMSHTAPRRASETYRERNFNKILDGHVVLDSMFDKIIQLQKQLKVA